MKVVNVRNGKGPAEDLFLDDTFHSPAITAGQALVEVKAFGLNRMDLTQRGASYPLPPGCSEILGVEFAGTILQIHPEGHEEIDDGTGHQFHVGDRVFGLVSGGAYAEHVATPLKTLLHLPHELSFEEGASIPEVWFTALQVVKFVGGLQANQSLLFHAGASGVGIAAIQIAQLLGARRIFATVGSDEKKEFLKTKLRLNGTADDVIIPINYKTEDFVQVVAQHEPQGVDVVIDPVGQSYFPKDLKIAARDGSIVVMGTMSGSVCQDNVDLKLVLGKRLRIIGTTLRSRTLDYQKELRDYIAQNLLPKIINKDLNIFVERIFEFDEIVESHKVMESNTTMGKLVVRTGL